MLSGTGKEYQVDFASMQQINTTNNQKRALRRFLCPSSRLPPLIWSWETDDGGSLISFDDDLSARSYVCASLCGKNRGPV
ncbi:Hypothetical protein NocV09_02700390 [Nannochloropsis oceanica]